MRVLLALSLAASGCAAPECRYEAEVSRWMHRGTREARLMPPATAWPDGPRRYKTHDGCNECDCEQVSWNSAMCQCTARFCADQPPRGATLQ